MTMIWLCLLLAVADYATTWVGITRYGARELNPVVAWGIRRLGLTAALGAFMLIRAGIVLCVATIAAVYNDPRPIVLVAAISAYPVISNSNRLAARPETTA